MAKVEPIEVLRKAHELAGRHGLNAQNYAAKLAAEAFSRGEIEESEFWKAVEAVLKPRIQGPG